MWSKNKASANILNFIVTNNTYLILVLLFVICSLASEHFLKMCIRDRLKTCRSSQ